ncbi:NTP transferase domain-containing protein [Halobacterium salinarum]|uniref:sugar phosphate nucleotidyltransferase n=1 Tax=Halobacterium salinarum TaxID=2242 RepID=UPI001F1AAA52|nr:sugar phosphate nucleotidyltransferase [Halobacterium salinarum]MCF2207528.1 NTP transferase domain-containing protein [Halobacterium salinarum]MCF2240720.1 NTP transferase domain-containing protein [Halobacterium salinarum]
MKAVIPAAGQGTRLYPQTHTRPKPMVRVAGKPILGHILDGFRDTQVDEIVVVVGVMREHVEEYVTAEYGEEFEIVFAEQATAEGLGHCIYQAQDHVVDEPICIALGDMLFDSGYGEFLDAHSDLDGVDGSIGVKYVDDPTSYGVVSTADGVVDQLVEKPSDPTSNIAISGVYIIEDTATLFDALQHLIDNDIRGAGSEYQLTDALQRMVEGGAAFGTFSVADWYDCGRPETLLDANRVLLDKSDETSAEATSGMLIQPVDIGSGVTIERSVVGPHVSVDDGATIRDSRVRDSIVGRNAALSSVNASDTIVGEDAVVEQSPMQLNVGDSSEVEL